MRNQGVLQKTVLLRFHAGSVNKETCAPPGIDVPEFLISSAQAVSFQEKP
ncbi:hypothetical protein GOB93_11435 [Acetobacter musti]|uniref:Uncharacterized protein n=1 Tax=Acetobacter musti TaxID=864732 RepID=A0ABX0JTH2_9PROT|nr:hypothetical protein [Acetobacter musti]